MRIYLASPFFNEAEKKLRDEVLKFLEDLGFDVYSPERDATKLVLAKEKVFKGFARRTDQFKIREINLIELTKCDLLLAVLNHPDTGTAFERGFAVAMQVPCLDFYKDKKDTDFYNLMLAEAQGAVDNYDDLEKFLIQFTRMYYKEIAGKEKSSYFASLTRFNFKEYQKLVTTPPTQEEIEARKTTNDTIADYHTSF